MWPNVYLPVLLGTAIAVVAVACLLRVLPRNRFVGIRTRDIMANDETWAKAHRVASPWMLVAAAVIFGSIAAPEMVVDPSWAPVVAALMQVLALALLFVGVSLGGRAARRILRLQELRSNRPRTERHG